MTKTYNIQTFQDAETYQVTLDENGVVSATELSDIAIEDLKHAVSRLMKKYNLPSITALGRVVGSYSTVSEANSDSVAESPPESVVP